MDRTFSCKQCYPAHHMPLYLRPPESTSSAQSIVEQGGGEYRGIQEVPANTGLKPLVLFNDPKSHDTLAVPVHLLSVAAVAARIAESRQHWSKQ